jgi:hypothetical protein
MRPGDHVHDCLLHFVDAHGTCERQYESVRWESTPRASSLLRNAWGHRFASTITGVAVRRVRFHGNKVVCHFTALEVRPRTKWRWTSNAKRMIGKAASVSVAAMVAWAPVRRIVAVTPLSSSSVRARPIAPPATNQHRLLPALPQGTAVG